MTETLRRRDLLKQLGRNAYEYRDEPFTLKSGKKSHHYVDCRPTLLEPKWRRLAGRLIVAELERAAHPLDMEGVAGVALGGIPLADAVSDELDIPAVYVRAEDKEHGKGGQLVIPKRLLSSLLLVEDVTTTGGSAMRAIKTIETQSRMQVRMVITLVDREEGASDLISLEGGWGFHSIFTLNELAREHKAIGCNGYP